eukprot:gb/GECH01002798.1/.p1 GENE.gb/GECH01002798.1/~~gb/GECH01002798.1/.p1  ORF type:complete len:559 (+),score=72.78 gb/GECH01002798.1/:1-1677(+)
MFSWIQVDLNDVLIALFSSSQDTKNLTHISSDQSDNTQSLPFSSNTEKPNNSHSTKSNSSILIATIFLIITWALLLRCAIAYSPYSGEHKPPMHGDFEAQRHWMEITVSLPLNEWYYNSTDNNLEYWGLDYPPLTAYHELILGLIGKTMLPEMIALHSSRGLETENIRLFVRTSVIIGDALVFIPAALLLVRAVYGSSISGAEALAVASYVLWHPALIIIDHGHFQYNGICLGLCFLGIYFGIRRQHFLGAFFFTLALNYKQIALYYSLPFFAFMLGSLLKRSSMFSRLKQLLGLAMIVCGTTACVWLPFIVTEGHDGNNGRSHVQQVLHRIFPFARGLYEDKVANIWCTLSVLVKINRILPSEYLIRFCSIITFLASLPSNINLLLRPSSRRFLLSIVNTSLAFFLFSFQVHEKTILFPLLPALVLVYLYPIAVSWFGFISMFSMYPLFIKDDLQPTYAMLMVFYYVFAFSFWHKKPSGKHVTKYASLAIHFLILIMLVIHFIIAFVEPPSRYPHLWVLLCTGFSCINFLGLFIYFNWQQWKCNDDSLKANIKVKSE